MRRVVLLCVAVIVLSVPAHAHPCVTWSTSESITGGVVLSVGSAYVLVGREGPCDPECMHTFWIYEEANGIEGLQRGDEIVDDTCHGMIAPDRVIL
jgi:hypothetical protein